MEEDPPPVMQPEDPPAESGSSLGWLGCLVSGVVVLTFLWVLSTAYSFLFGHWSFG